MNVVCRVHCECRNLFTNHELQQDVTGNMNPGFAMEPTLSKKTMQTRVPVCRPHQQMKSRCKLGYKPTAILWYRCIQLASHTSLEPRLTGDIIVLKACACPIITECIGGRPDSFLCLCRSGTDIEHHCKRSSTREKLCGSELGRAWQNFCCSAQSTGWQASSCPVSTTCEPGAARFSMSPSLALYSPDTTAVFHNASFEQRYNSLGRQGLGKAQRGLLNAC